MTALRFTAQGLPTVQPVRESDVGKETLMKRLWNKVLRRPAVVAVAGVLAATCFTVPASSAAPVTSSVQAASAVLAQRAVAPPAWRKCGDGFECASIPVPRDYSQPNGPAITIALARFPASDPAKRIGSVFLNPGGPGGSGVDMARGLGAPLDQLLGGRLDIVGFDPRGVGASTSVRCFTGPVEEAQFYANQPVFPVGRQEQERYSATTKVLTDSCGARNGELLRHVSTENTARDLDVLRAAVGDEALTYLGGSYGTILGATYANLFPDRIRALVLDGVSDPEDYTSDLIRWTAGSLRDTEAVLAGFARSCTQAGPQLCALAGNGNVQQRVERLLNRLRRAPIPAPKVPEVPGGLDYATTVGILFISLYSTGAWPALAAGIAAAENGDGSPLLAVTSQLIAGRPAGSAQQDPYNNFADARTAIICTDSPSPRDPARWPSLVRRLERVSPHFAALLTWGTDLPCATWPARAADRYTGPWNARTSNPVLLIGVTKDPITPLASARKLARLMGPSAVLLTHDGYGHTSFGQISSCTLDIVSAYLVTTLPPPRGTVCRPDAPPFLSEAARKAGTPHPLQRFSAP